MQMTSNKPYLIRALHEWIWDNDCTPYLYINTSVAEVVLPPHLRDEMPLVLNASPNACKDLAMVNDSISFQARFSGEVHDIYLPMDSVIAIVSRETGEGMTFELPSDESPDQDTSTDNSDKSTTASTPEKEAEQPSKRKKGGLKIVE